MERWLRIVKEEVGHLEGCLENLPDGPVLLYDVAPPPGALPLFYPVLYLGITEPADGEEYEEITKKIQVWEAQMKENLKTMGEALNGEGIEPETMKDMFTTWGLHQKSLIRICNWLMQHHLLNQYLPAIRQEKLVTDMDVQWLAERLLKARIEANRQTFGSWLATAHWCV